MLSIRTILEAIVTDYKAIAGIVNAVGDDDEAIAFLDTRRPEQPSYEAVLAEMRYPSILVSHQGIVLGLRGNYTQWRHLLRVDMKLMGEDVDYSDLIPLLIDGIPTGKTLTIMQCSFLDAVDSMEDVSVVRIQDSNGKDFYRMDFALQEKVA